MLKGFAIALSAKIRYEKQQDSSYKIIFNPFVICDSIKYNELEKLYNILFDEEKQTESKFDMNLLFVKLYREVVYLLSYSVGIYIKEFLENYSYEVKYENKSKNSYLRNFDSKYESHDFAEIYKIIRYKLNEFSYTKISNNDDLDNNVYSQNQTLISLYDAITTDSQKKQISEYNYNFVEMKDISFLHTVDNLMNFITSMYQLIENYTISQEIEFNFANSRIERGFVNGENGDVILPVERPEAFIKVLLNYYKRTNRDFDIYMENYDLFIDKFYNILLIEELFDKELVLYDTFDYLKKYFKRLNRTDFIRKIEGKEVYIQNEEEFPLMNYVNEKMNIIFESSDFTYNK